MFNILSRRGLPIYGTFFLWSFGTGANQLARPLFAASFGVPLALVALVTASNSFSHLLAGPLTGYAMDRWGRKPLLILGLILRGGSLILEFFATSYPQYLALEFLGGVGVAIWGTGASVLIADLSVRENRGRALAVRGMATRLGAIVGPIVGAAIAAAFDLRTIFLFNGITKFVILAMVLRLVGETRPDAAGEPARRSHGIAFDLLGRMFMNRPFLAVAAATFAISMMHQGVFAAILPVYVTREIGLSPSDVGTLITLAAAISLGVSFPNGYLVDLFGRKSTLVPGLGILAIAAYLLSISSDHASIVLMVAVYGLGEGICMGASQAYAMDLAPEDRRGSFIGVWSLLQNVGGITAPVLLGLVAEQFGFGLAFVGVAAVLLLVAVAMWAFAPDTTARRSRPAASVSPLT
jgi:DHA1 family multidrug resistance protein-like MFS transporter